MTFERVDGIERSASIARAARATADTDRYSLSDVVDAGGETRQVHPLVTRTMRFHDSDVDRTAALQAAVGSALADLVGEVLAAGAREDSAQDLIAHGRALLAAAGPVSARGRIADEVARYDFLRGNYREAREAQTAILARRRTLLGGDHVATLTAEIRLASTLHSDGDLAAARELQEEVLSKSRRLFGDEHGMTAMAMVNLASTLHDTGDLEQARDLEGTKVGD